MNLHCAMTSMEVPRRARPHPLHVAHNPRPRHVERRADRTSARGDAGNVAEVVRLGCARVDFVAEEVSKILHLARPDLLIKCN